MFRPLAVQVAAGVDHENSTTEGSIFTHAFPANFWQVGKVVKADLGCIVSDNNSTDTLTLALRLGAAALTGTAFATSAAVDVADGDVGLASVTLMCRSVGATGVVVASAILSEADATGTISTKAFGPVLVTVDTTAASYLAYTADWSVAHADNEVACEMAAVYEIA